jgi:isovaleryl-CoA dehydrogenase
VSIETTQDLRKFGFSEDHQSVYDMIWRYAREELYPLLERMDQEDWFPEEKLRSLHEVGLLGITIPEQYGGMGMDLITQCVAAEAMAYWNHCFAISWLGSENVCAHNIVRNASEEIKQRFLPRLCSGEAIGALGCTEPGAGSDIIGSMRTTAVRNGDEYILNGRKMFITNGSVADMILTYARTDPEAGARGISAILVEKGMPGFSVAQKLDKMGWRGSPTVELVFDDCRVPAANIVGEENAGIGVIMSGLNIERVLMCFFSLGIAQRALDLSVDYARQRKQFGKAIGEFQLIQGLLADMYTDVETMRAFAYQMGKEVADLEIGGGGRGEIHKRSAAVTLNNGRALNRVLDNGVQIHGGMGFMRESEINKLYRGGKVLEIAPGSTQIRQIIIGQELTK